MVFLSLEDHFHHLKHVPKLKILGKNPERSPNCAKETQQQYKQMRRKLICGVHEWIKDKDYLATPSQCIKLSVYCDNFILLVVTKV